MSVYQKLAKIRTICDIAKKDKRGYNYTYTDITEILANVKAGMKKYGVSLIPSIVPGTARIEQNVVKNVKYTKDGDRLETVTTEMLFCAEMQYAWVNDDNPADRIDIPWFATASMSDPAQSFGASMSYNLRQFLTNYFQITQIDNDIDAYRSKQKEAEEREDRMIADAITDTILETINAHLESHPDARDEFVAIVRKYAKSKGGKPSANPKDITDPTVASKLLKEIQGKCGQAAA